MSKLRWRIDELATIVGLLALSTPGDSRAQGAGDICLMAQIVNISGVERRGGVTILSPARLGQRRQREARLRECLSPGEQVRVIAPGAEVVVRLRGGAQTLTARTPPLTIPDRAEPGIWDRVRAFGLALRIFSTTPEVAVAETYARRSLGAVRPHPLLPPAGQFLPRGQRSITVVWDGPEALVELDNSSGRIVDSVWNARGNKLTFENLTLDGNYSLLVASNLRYAVTIVDPARIPEPDWMAGHVSTSDDERVARALWLLVDGPTAWRLFAIDELRRLQTTSFAAERIWEWVLTTNGAVRAQ